MTEIPTRVPVSKRAAPFALTAVARLTHDVRSLDPVDLCRL